MGILHPHVEQPKKRLEGNRELLYDLIPDRSSYS